MKKINSNFLWSCINAIGSIFIKIGTLIIISRLIGPYEFGIYSMGISFVLILSTLIQLGIPTSIATSLKEENYSGLGLIVSLILSLFFCLSLGYILNYFNLGDLDKYSKFFIYLIAFQVLINVIEAVARKELNFKGIAKSEIISSFLGSCVFTLILAINNFGIYSLIMGQFVYCFIKLFILIFFTYKNLNFVFNKINFKKIFNNAFSVTLSEISNVALIQIQRPIIGYNIGSSAAGIWSRVYQIIIIQLSVIVQPIDYMALPMLSRLRADRKYLEEVVLSLLQMVSIFTLLSAVITIFLAPIIIPFILGSKWLNLIVPLQIGAIIVFFRSIERLLLSISRAIGVMGFRALIQIIQLLLVVISLIIFSKFGLIVASWALVLSMLAGLLLSLYTTKLTIGIPSKKIIKSIFPSIILFTLPVTCFFLTHLFFIYYISLFISLTLLVALIFIIIYYRRFFFEKINQDYFEKIKSKFTRIGI